MNRPELIDSTPIPGSKSQLRLFKTAAGFSIKLDGIGGELMNTHTHGSEDQLAELTCPRIADREKPRVLIGGLGMGFTLAAALRNLGDSAEVVVAELVPGVVRWNHGPLGEHAGYPVRDPRTTVHEGDVAALLKTQRDAYDAILLDVDNGPDGLTQDANSWLYAVPGLNAAMAALRPKGLLAVWSAGPDPRFTLRLRKCGFATEEKSVRAHGNKGARHMIWIAEKP
jgi:spermidine synthase